MKITWTETREATFNVPEAIETYHTILEWDPDEDPEQAIWDATKENLYYDEDIVTDENTPFIKALEILHQQIGGVQMRMEGI